MCGGREARGPGACGKSPEETEGRVGTRPVGGSVVAGSGSDTLLYRCSHLCELRRRQEGRVIENISRREKAGEQEWSRTQVMYRKEQR